MADPTRNPIKEKQMDEAELKRVVSEYGQEELFQRLVEVLGSVEQTVTVYRVLREEDFCARCGSTGPYCCYDSVLE